MMLIVIRILFLSTLYYIITICIFIIIIIGSNSSSNIVDIFIHLILLLITLTFNLYLYLLLQKGHQSGQGIQERGNNCHRIFFFASVG